MDDITKDFFKTVWQLKWIFLFFGITLTTLFYLLLTIVAEVLKK